MTVQITHAARVEATERLVGDIAGGKMVEVQHALSAAGNESFQNVWSQKLTGPAVTPLTLTLSALDYPQRVGTIDLDTGQAVFSSWLVDPVFEFACKVLSKR